MKTLLLSGLSALALALLPSLSGCTSCGVQDAPLSLDSLPIAEESGMQMKDDKVSGTWAWVRPTGTITQCIMAPCPSFSLRGVNGDASRPVEYLDLRSLKMSPAEELTVYQKSGAMLLRGRYVTLNKSAVFQVTQARVALGRRTDTDDPKTLRYYAVTPESGCQKAPCERYEGTLLGKSEKIVWTAMDMRAMELTPAEQGQCDEDLQKGLLSVAVDGNAQAMVNQSARVMQAFRPLR